MNDQTRMSTKEAWDKLSAMPQAELESHLYVNPATGKPDGVYSLVCQTATPENLAFLMKRDGITLEQAKNSIIKLAGEVGVPVPPSLMH
jgi:hypothetical protein